MGGAPSDWLLPRRHRSGPSAGSGRRRWRRCWSPAHLMSKPRPLPSIMFCLSVICDLFVFSQLSFVNHACQSSQFACQSCLALLSFLTCQSFCSYRSSLSCQSFFLTDNPVLQWLNHYLVNHAISHLSINLWQVNHLLINHLPIILNSQVVSVPHC